jgi:hypothetical protein
MKTLAEILSTAKVASATPAPVKAEPAKAAAAAPTPVAPAAPVVAEPAKAAAAEPTKQASAEQAWCAANGLGDNLPQKTAEILFGQAVEATKQAEAETKLAMVREMENRGVLQYHGMMKEACAARIMSKAATYHDLITTAAVTRCHPDEIIARAQELQKQAEIIGAQVPMGWYRQFLGDGADPAANPALAAAQTAADRREYVAGASGGTRQPVSGVDEKLLRFQEAVTIPGNPGIAAAGIEQPVIQGKG